MSHHPEPNYQTRLIHVDVPHTPPLKICSLLNRQQYSDPDGEAYKLGISSALWSLSGLLWPSAIYLAAELALRAPRPDERILEIGCGLALPSLVCHRLGMDVTASDHHPLTHEFLRRNLALNHLPDTLKYRYGHWGQNIRAAKDIVHDHMLAEQYDFIIGSDLLYERDAAPALAQFIHGHAKPSAEVWLIDANRGYRPAFTRSMAANGFDLYENTRLNRRPCLSGAPSYKGHLLKYRRQEQAGYPRT